MSDYLMNLKNILKGENINYQVPSHKLNRKGSAKGFIKGGNLSLIYALHAYNNEISYENRILFIEDLDEYLYHIDRMMVSLKGDGRLMKLAGLIVGGMTEMKDNTVPFGKTAEEIIYEHVAEYDFPVCFNFPAGHIPNNNPMILGREVELIVGEKVELIF